MIPLHVVPTSIPDVVHPPFDALSVQVEHQQEYDTDQGQHQSQEHVRSPQHALHLHRALQLVLLQLQKWLASQVLGVRAGQVLDVDDLSGVLQPHQRVLDKAVAMPGVPCQLDAEVGLKAELCHHDAGQIFQAVVPQVKVTQWGHSESPVVDVDDGAVLQAEADQAGKTSEYITGKNHKVIVGQIQDCQLDEVPAVQEI